ncbi:unnamed protein product, partial [Amoebophrya sp. A25]
PRSRLREIEDLVTCARRVKMKNMVGLVTVLRIHLSTLLFRRSTLSSLPAVLVAGAGEVVSPPSSGADSNADALAAADGVDNAHDHAAALIFEDTASSVLKHAHDVHDDDDLVVGVPRSQMLHSCSCSSSEDDCICAICLDRIEPQATVVGVGEGESTLPPGTLTGSIASDLNYSNIAEDAGAAVNNSGGRGRSGLSTPASDYSASHEDRVNFSGALYTERRRKGAKRQPNPPPVYLMPIPSPSSWNGESTTATTAKPWILLASDEGHDCEEADMFSAADSRATTRLGGYSSERSGTAISRASAGLTLTSGDGGNQHETETRRTTTTSSVVGKQGGDRAAAPQGGRATTFPCGHQFHTACIRSHALTQVVARKGMPAVYKCALCRQPAGVVFAPRYFTRLLESLGFEGFTFPSQNGLRATERTTVATRTRQPDLPAHRRNAAIDEHRRTSDSEATTTFDSESSSTMAPRRGTRTRLGEEVGDHNLQETSNEELHDLANPQRSGEADEEERNVVDEVLAGRPPS